MYKVHYRVWADNGLVCLDGVKDMFCDAFDRVEGWLENDAIYARIARIEFERIDEDEKSDRL